MIRPVRRSRHKNQNLGDRWPQNFNRLGIRKSKPPAKVAGTAGSPSPHCHSPGAAEMVSRQCPHTSVARNGRPLCRVAVGNHAPADADCHSYALFRAIHRSLSHCFRACRFTTGKSLGIVVGAGILPRRHLHQAASHREASRRSFRKDYIGLPLYLELAALTRYPHRLQ